MTFLNVDKIYEDAKRANSKLARGRVWCHNCGASRKVDAAKCLRRGWPKCCGEIMSIDSPDERAART